MANPQFDPGGGGTTDGSSETEDSSDTGRSGPSPEQYRETVEDEYSDETSGGGGNSASGSGPPGPSPSEYRDAVGDNYSDDTSGGGGDSAGGSGSFEPPDAQPGSEVFDADQTGDVASVPDEQRDALRQQIASKSDAIDEGDIRGFRETSDGYAPLLTGNAKAALARKQAADKLEGVQASDVQGFRETSDGPVAVFDPNALTTQPLDRSGGGVADTDKLSELRKQVASENPDLNPNDIAGFRQTESGAFEPILTEQERRERVAEQNPEIDEQDIQRVERTESGAYRPELTREAQQEIARERIAEQDPDVDEQDIQRVERTDVGEYQAVLTDEARVELAREQFLDQREQAPDIPDEFESLLTVDVEDATRPLSDVPAEEVQFETTAGGEVDAQLTDRGLRIAAAAERDDLQPTDLRVVGDGDSRSVELARESPDVPSGGPLNEETLLKTTSPGARFFGTQEREEAIEELAQEGSVSGQVFVGAEAIEQTGVEGSQALDEIVPEAGGSVTIPYTPFLGATRETELNPRVGIGTEGERSSTQARNFVVNVPTGAGVALGLPGKAAGDIGVRAEAAVSDDVPEAATISAGASTAAVGRAGGKFVEGIKQEPVGAALDILTPYAVSRASPIRLRQTEIPETNTDAPSPSTARQLGGAAEAIRRGESPRTIADANLGTTPTTSSTTVTGVRLETPAAVQRLTGPSRGRTLVGFRGNRPTAGSPSVDPQRVDFAELPGQTATTEPIDPLRTDVLQATGRQAGGETAARTQATRELVGRAAGETVPGSRRIRQAADTIGVEASQRLGRARARAAGAANRITEPISEPLGRAASTARDVARRPVAAARQSGTEAGVRIGERLAGGVRRGQQARQRLGDTTSTVTDPVTRRVEALDDAAFQAGRRTGETLSRLDDAAFQAGRRVGETQADLAQRVGRTRGRLSDLATRTVQRPRSAVQRATRPLTRPIEQRAFQAGRRTGETISRVESTAERLTPDLPSRPGRRTVGPAEDIVREVRAVPGDRAGDVVDALDETGATIFGSAAVRGQADEFRQPRDLDVIVPDEAAARERFSEALEGSNADVEDVFDIKQIEDAPGRARGGERIKFGQQSREKLETDEGIPVNPIEEELLRKAGAAGFFRAPGAAGTARFDVGPEPRRAGRADVREKDIYDAVDIGEEVFGPGDPAVEQFRSAFTDQPAQTPAVRGGDPDATGFDGLLADERGQATLTPRGRGGGRDVDVDGAVDGLDDAPRARQRGETNADPSPAPRRSPNAPSPRVSGGALAFGFSGATASFGSPADEVLGSPTSEAFASPAAGLGSPTSTTPGVGSPAVGAGVDSPSAPGAGAGDLVPGSPAAPPYEPTGFEAGVTLSGPTLALTGVQRPAQPAGTSGREPQDSDVEPFFGGGREADFTDFRNPLEYEEIIETQPAAGETPGQAAAFDDPELLGFLDTSD